MIDTKIFRELVEEGRSSGRGIARESFERELPKGYGAFLGKLAGCYTANHEFLYADVALVDLYARRTEKNLKLQQCGEAMCGKWNSTAGGAMGFIGQDIERGFTWVRREQYPDRTSHVNRNMTTAEMQCFRAETYAEYLGFAKEDIDHLFANLWIVVPKVVSYRRR